MNSKSHHITLSSKGANCSCRLSQFNHDGGVAAQLLQRFDESEAPLYVCIWARTPTLSDLQALLNRRLDPIASAPQPTIITSDQDAVKDSDKAAEFPDKVNF